MARKVNGSSVISTINVMYVTDNGELKTTAIVEHRKVTETAARNVAKKRFGFNAMVTSIDYDYSSASISADTFIANSSVCVDGQSYGHDVITKEFKISVINAMIVLADGTLQEVHMSINDTTTLRKAQNMVCERYETQNAIITGIDVTTERRYMTREKFNELAN